MGMQMCSSGPQCERACGSQCGSADLDAALQEQLADPAGTAFADTIKHLSTSEQLLFHFAAMPNVAALRWLLLRGSSADVSDANATTLLHVACRTGGGLVVQELLKRGLSPDKPDSAGWTPLHVAACMGRSDVTLWLLQAGGRLRCRNARGQIPEDLCSRSFMRDVVRRHEDSTHRRAGSRYLFAARAPLRQECELEPSNCAGAPDLPRTSSMLFKQIFVQREPLVRVAPASDKQLCHTQIGLATFRRNPGRGIAFFVAANAVRDSPSEINSFLLKVAADPMQLGEFLGEDNPLARSLRLEFLSMLPLQGSNVISALAIAFRDVAVPADPLKIDRLAEGLAHFWWVLHDNLRAEAAATGEPSPYKTEFSGLDLLHRLRDMCCLRCLFFSALMLKRWFAEGRELLLKQWLELNVGCGLDGDTGVSLRARIYEDIVSGKAVFGRGPRKQPLMLQEVKPAVSGWSFVRYGCQGGTSRTSAQTLVEQGGSTFIGTSKLQDATAHAEATVEGGTEESAWVALHGTLLILAATTVAADIPVPYAFVTLRESSVEVKARSMTLTLRGYGVTSERMGLCLLLDDGRFQLLSAPWLDLRLESPAALSTWAKALGDVCHLSKADEQQRCSL